MKRILGLDVGGTKCAAVIGLSNGEVLARSEWPSRASRGPDAMLQELVWHARALGSFDVAGVSIGGPLDSHNGVIYSPPNLPGWDAFPLKAKLSELLACSVNVEHDAAACAYAEYLWGAGKDCQHLAYLTCGTGFGVGFVFHGKIHRGAGGGSCEVGHIRLRAEGPVAYGRPGSAESYCSGTALGLLAAWRFRERWGATPPDGRMLHRLACEGDEDAREILRINAEAVGEVAAMLAEILGLDCILIGSLATYLGNQWLARVRQSFEDRALPTFAKICRISAAGLGARLQDCSALAAAL